VGDLKRRPPAQLPWRPALRTCLHAAAGLALALALLQPARAVDMGRLKAAVVYNLLLFAEWPTEALPTEQPALHLCVDAASAPLESLLALAGKPVGTRRLEVRKVPATAEGLRACNAWYREGPAPVPSGTVWRAVQRHSVLTICTGELREDGGAAIYLSESNGRLYFDVDNAAVRQLGLQLSSKMLRLARRVHD
jgi:YfiR/HmsC-like